ncbi:MAG: T9SS type A sorting domain-containing protein [Bacteroidales bacterium]|jgi:hypothetical protein|nr:T9SS type A sorting domain-containing protein [Bacteroidales bacterium]
MKKLLLLGLAFGIMLSAYPQKVYKSNKELKKNNTERRTDASFYKTGSEFQPNAVQLKEGTSAMVDRVEMGKSGNVYSVLTSYQRCLAYEPITGTLQGTHRADPATYPAALASGTIMAHMSTDMGQNWNHVMVLNPDPDVYALRYPSGVAYLHEGMGTYDDLYPVVCGPSHTGGTWNYTYYGSAKVDETNGDVYYYPWSATGNDWGRSSMTIVPGAVYNFGQDYTSVGNLGVNQTMKQYIGTTEDPATGFEWEINEFTPDWVIDPADGHAVALYTTWSAWSLDGSIGYMWMIGATNETYDYGVYQPQLAYTTDGGENWDELYIDLEDHPALVEYLPPWQDAAGNPGTVRPTFLTGDRTYPGVVDYEGKLHLFSNVFGSSAGDVLDPDNGYWIVNGLAGGHIFDFIIDQDGLVDVIFVDSVLTDVAPDNAFGDVTWDHRLQASKSVDEQAVFCVWADDFTGPEPAEVLNPDIKGWGYAAMDQTPMGEPVNFTQDDLFSGFYFFHYVSELTPKIGDFYEIPVSTSVTITEFQGNDAGAPITHTYVGGIGFTYVGVDDNVADDAQTLSVSQNIPNPAVNSTVIEISSETVAPARVEVTNMVGQTVYSADAGIVNGSKKVTIDVSSFDSGVYFYTVTVGSERVSNKMIVK